MRGPLPGRRRGAAVAVALVVVAVVALPAAGQDRGQTTTLISRSASGNTPNGPSTNGVISADQRFASVIAFESEASDIVRADRNGVKDVFAIRRAGRFGNNGSVWRPGPTLLLSRGTGGEPANGPSSAPVIGSSAKERPRCVAFLSEASNLVGGDTNGKVDAFVSRGPGDAPSRISSLGSGQTTADTTAVAASGDCSRFAFVSGKRLYTRVGSRVVRLSTRGTPSDPSFSTGYNNDLVFAARGGVYLSAGGTGRPKLIAKGGRDPSYHDRARVVAYERTRGGRVQIAYRRVGRGGEGVASQFRRQLGNGDSRDPVVGGTGAYITFETDAGNLQTDSNGERADRNGRPDVYIWSRARDITLVQSVRDKGVPLPGGGRRPSPSDVINYVVFDSPAPLGSRTGPPQVFMRYLGGR